MASNPKITFKVLIIGDTMVGKSCILLRYADNTFDGDIQPTIGVDYRPSLVNVRNKLVKLMIWDTAGQEKFRSITKSFYHGAHGALVVYDVTNMGSFSNVDLWLRELKNVRGHVPVVLVGNKTDVQSRDEVQENAANIFANERGLQHIFASAQSGHNIKEAFLTLTEMMMDEASEAEEPMTKLEVDGQKQEFCCC